MDDGLDDGCDGAAVHGLKPVANRLGRRDALAGRDGVLDARQLLDEAPAARDDQAVVGDVAGARVQNSPVIAEPDGLGSAMVDTHAPEKGPKIDTQVIALAQPGRHPDEARVVDEFRLRADDGDVERRVRVAQRRDGRQRAEAGAHDAYAVHRLFSSVC